MKDSNKIKLVIAWISLLIFLVMLLVLNYIKFFGFYDYSNDVTEEQVDNSSEEAINLALSDIVNNFNGSQEVMAFKEQNVEINARLKNRSIYISYIDEVTTTYEFNYNNLLLSINIKNDIDSISKFNKIYSILIKAIQIRLNNVNVDELIKLHIDEDKELNGIEKEVSEDVVKYKIDITKKVREGE